MMTKKTVGPDTRKPFAISLPSIKLLISELSALSVKPSDFAKSRVQPRFCNRNRDVITCKSAALILGITTRQIQRIVKAGFIAKPYTALGVVQGYSKWTRRWKRNRSLKSRSAKLQFRIRELRLEKLTRERIPNAEVSDAFERFYDRVRAPLLSLVKLGYSTTWTTRVVEVLWSVFQSVEQEISYAKIRPIQ